MNPNDYDDDEDDDDDIIIISDDDKPNLNELERSRIQVRKVSWCQTLKYIRSL